MNFLVSLFGNKTLLFTLLAGVVLVSGSVYIKLLKSNIDILEKEKSVLEEKLALSQNSVSNLRSAIDEQNKAVQQLKSDAEQREKANKAELDRARARAEAFRQNAANISRRPPPPGLSDYEAANEIINEEIRREK